VRVFSEMKGEGDAADDKRCTQDSGNGIVYQPLYGLPYITDLRREGSYQEKADAGYAEGRKPC